jgi:hypothetical protein
MQEYEHRSGRKDGVDSEDEVKLEDAWSKSEEMLGEFVTVN